MLGAICGDVVGSVYEGAEGVNLKSKDFPLFSDWSRFTDDSVMTIAVAQALLDGGTKDDFINALQEFGNLYPGVGYGGMFIKWFLTGSREPYNSWGNGSAMRVSPCAWWAESLDEALDLAKRSGEVTHNHPEGIKGAQAIAAATYLARTSSTKQEIRDYVTSQFGYDLSRTLDSIRPTYKWDVSCQGSVPEAIIAFLESSDFEDAIRNAVSIGGDSDTIAAMAGAIAEAFYGIPHHIQRLTLAILDEPLTAVLRDWVRAGKLSEISPDLLGVEPAGSDSSMA